MRFYSRTLVFTDILFNRFFLRSPSQSCLAQHIIIIGLSKAFQYFFLHSPLPFLLSYAGYVFYAYSIPQGLSGIIITDSEYPQRVAFSLLNKVVEEFLVRFPKQTWTQKINFPELREYLIRYQDPKQGDQIMKVQDQLDETKQVMVRIYNLAAAHGIRFSFKVDARL